MSFYLRSANSATYENVNAAMAAFRRILNKYFTDSDMIYRSMTEKQLPWITSGSAGGSSPGVLGCGSSPCPFSRSRFSRQGHSTQFEIRATIRILSVGIWHWASFDGVPHYSIVSSVESHMWLLILTFSAAIALDTTPVLFLRAVGREMANWEDLVDMKIKMNLDNYLGHSFCTRPLQGPLGSGTHPTYVPPRCQV